MPLELRLRGQPSLYDGRQRTPLDRKTAAVLALLALEGQQTRGKLASWLWSEATSARNSLRQVVFKLPKGLLVGHDPLCLAADVPVDLHRLQGADQPVGANAGSGELLGSFTYDDCPAFDDWLFTERQRLAFKQLEDYAKRCAALEAAHDYGAALDYAKRLVALEALSEANHRRVMRLHEALGDRAAAVRAFEACRHVLRRELNLEPSLETQRLALLVARGVRLPSLSHVPVSLPQRLADSNREVAALLEATRVLDSLGRTQTAFDTMLAASAVLSEIEATDALERLIAELSSRARSAEQHAKTALASAWLHYQRGQFAETIRQAERGLELTSDAGLRSQLEAEIAAALLRLDRTTEALGWQQRAVESLPHHSLEAAVALAEYALSLANADRYVEAEAAYLEADALLELFGARRQRITLLNNLAMTYKHQGRAQAALEPLEIAARLLSELPGLVDDERYGYANRAEVLTQLGRLNEALEWLARAEQLSMTHDLPCSFVYYRRAQVNLLLNRPDDAERDLERALASAGVHAKGVGFAQLLDARIRAQRGADWDAALTQAERSLEQSGPRSYLLRAHLLRAARSAPAQGRRLALIIAAGAAELGMGGLEISALAIAISHAPTDAAPQRDKAHALLETLEPLDLTRAAVLELLAS